jgi:ferric-dicitrate binding protein FerR (iron transport regulator)
VKEAIERAYNDLKENLKNKLQHKFRVTTGSCAVAVRGTDFILSEQPVAGTEVHVLEGSVEIKGYGSDQSVVVEAGFSCNVTSEGAISGPYKTDLYNLDKWWEEAKPE